jgi:hypothetical protein
VTSALFFQDLTPVEWYVKIIHAFRELVLKNVILANVILKNVHSRECLFGGVSEWFKEAVLKTVVPQGTVGSNPSSSAR